MAQNQVNLEKKQIMMMIFGGIALIVIIIIAMSITTIEAGHVGVKKVFGAVNAEVLPEGLHIIAPWVSVVEVDAKVQNINVEAKAGMTNAAVSKDTQTVGFQVDLAYNVNSIDAWMLIKYVGATHNNWKSTIIEPAMWQGVKEVISRYGLDDIVVEREEVRKAIGDSIKVLVRERLTERFKESGNVIQINQVTLRNIDYAPEYEQAITKKQVAAQSVLTADYELNRFQIEQKQAVAKAEQEAKANVKKAEGDARAKVINANGEALAYLTKLEAEIISYAKLRSVGFSPATYNFLAKWDGKLP
ncbi:MAG: prohibitin family protein, partial [Planctomycetes bacterium]|nr:prohibitin family protein [Planctomycetota bacterium]